jgi:arylsulfatase A-like enzyme
MLPTFAYLAGAKVPDDRVIDGENLWPLLTGEKPRGVHPYFHYFAGTRVGVKPNYRAIRGIKWKLILKKGPEGKLEADELYDLGEDPSERFNRLDQHPKIANQLLEQAKTFYAELQANRRPLGRVREGE